MSPNQKMVLIALATSYAEDRCFCVMSFLAIANRSGLEIRLVRRTVRALARKGFASYERGCWTDDGEMAGSGYQCTQDGFAYARQQGFIKEESDT
jgi:hypothetical protein